MSKRILLMVACCFGLAISAQSNAPLEVISEQEVNQARTLYGELAARRLLALQTLISENSDRPERLQLNLVNEFFSKVTFLEDKVIWKQDDFWATPAELLAQDKGDAEDFAIAKYFTLLALWVDEKKLYFSYVTSTRLKKSHIVLTYFRSAKSEPLVLDSLTDRILKASARPDLIPIYSFNCSNIDSSSQRLQEKGLDGSMHQWSQMLQRMQTNQVK